MSAKDFIKKNRFVIGGVLLAIFVTLIVVVVVLNISGNGDDEEEEEAALACKAGTFLRNGRCDECESGTYSWDGATKCIECGEGRYSGVGSDKCSICPGGTYSSKGGAGTCAICPAGTYASAGSNACKQCPDGRYSSEGSVTCDLECEAGTFFVDGSGVCEACPSGTYSSKGASGCTACQAGRYAPPGSSRCEACQAGQYTNDDSSGCLSCPAGTYSDTASVECTECPQGRASSMGSASCEVCPVGTYSTKGSGVCTLCAPGRYNDTPGNYYCKICPEASYSEGEGASECVSCPPGTAGEWGGPGGKTSKEEACQLCPAGEYIDPDRFSDTVCSTCGSTEPGWYLYSLPGSYADGCGPCNTGKYVTQGASDPTTFEEWQLYCTNCPENTYIGAGESKPDDVYENGVSTKCTPCPPDSISEPGSGICTSTLCQITDTSSLWNEYNNVKLTCELFTNMKSKEGFNSLIYFFPSQPLTETICAKACDDTWLNQVRNSSLKLVSYTPEELNNLSNINNEQIIVYNLLIGMAVSEKNNNALATDISTLNDGFNLNRTLSLQPPGNICVNEPLDYFFEGVQWGPPFYMPFVFGWGCRWLPYDEFEGVFKRTGWYNGFRPNSAVWSDSYNTYKTQIDEMIETGSEEYKNGVVDILRDAFNDQGLLPNGFVYHTLGTGGTIPPVPTDNNLLENYPILLIMMGALTKPDINEWMLGPDIEIMPLATCIVKLMYNLYTLHMIHCENNGCATNEDRRCLSEDGWKQNQGSRADETITSTRPGC